MSWIFLTVLPIAFFEELNLFWILNSLSFLSSVSLSPRVYPLDIHFKSPRSACLKRKPHTHTASTNSFDILTSISIKTFQLSNFSLHQGKNKTFILYAQIEFHSSKNEVTQLQMMADTWFACRRRRRRSFSFEFPVPNIALDFNQYHWMCFFVYSIAIACRAFLTLDFNRFAPDVPKVFLRIG